MYEDIGDPWHFGADGALNTMRDVVPGPHRKVAVDGVIQSCSSRGCREQASLSSDTIEREG
jgi:hypothetical protein